MPNWWLPWAERIARVLAEAWLRSQPSPGPDAAAPADRAASLDPDAPAPAVAPPAGDTAPPGGFS